MKNKIGAKLLKIEELYFFLPDDFFGTYGDALTLLAEYQKERESENKMLEGTGDAWNDLINNETARHASHFVIAEKTNRGWIDMNVEYGVAERDDGQENQENVE